MTPLVRSTPQVSGAGQAFMGGGRLREVSSVRLPLIGLGMKLQVVNILADPPGYGADRARSRPPVSWDTPNGGWVGRLGLRLARSAWRCRTGAPFGTGLRRVAGGHVGGHNPRPHVPKRAHTPPVSGPRISAPLSFGLIREVFSAELVARLREVARQRGVRVGRSRWRRIARPRSDSRCCERATGRCGRCRALLR